VVHLPFETHAMDSRPQTDFESLAGSSAFTEFAASLRRLTGLPLSLSTPGVTITRAPPSGGHSNPLCELIRGTPRGESRCQACDRRYQAQAAATRRARLYTCHAGFLDMAVPLFVDGRHVATISCGQVLPEPRSAAAAGRLRRRLGWLRVSQRAFQAAYRRAPYLPRAHLRDVIRLLEIFGGHLCESASRIRQLEARLEREEVRAAREYVEQNFRNPRMSLADVAHAAGLSRAHFSLVFHQATGMTFTRFVQSRRAAEARRLLETTDRDITSICFDCGFNSLTHCNRVFRHFTPCSPREYRHRMRQTRA
jgi:AraC-like DNA-binding protein